MSAPDQNQPPNGLPEPKVKIWNQPVIISKISAFIALLAVIVTIFNNRLQNSRWKQINEANIKILSVDFVKQKKYNLPDTTVFGYVPDTLFDFEDNQKILLNHVEPFISGTLTDIPIRRKCYTAYEAVKELSNINYAGLVDLWKAYQIELRATNIGKTEASSIAFTITPTSFSNPTLNLGSQKTRISTLGEGLSYGTFLDFHLSIIARLPDTVGIRIKIEYGNADGDHVEKPPIYFKWLKHDPRFLIVDPFQIPQNNNQ